MKKQEEKETLIENKNIHKSVMWLVDRRKQFFSIIAIIVFSGVIAYKTIPHFGKRGSEGAVLADNAYQGWKNEPQDHKQLLELNKFLKKYPNIKSKYEGLVIQQLLVNENISEEALFMANKALNRTGKELPFYSKYARASILISERKFEEALKEAKKLKNEMLHDVGFLKDGFLPAGPVLYSFNLLRIAFLEKELLQDENEYKAWIELEKYLNVATEVKTDKSIKKAVEILKNSFKENSIELADYISYRKNQLSSK